MCRNSSTTSKPEDPDVSVIIPVFCGRATIVSCLASVERAASDRCAEIVVVESFRDGTAELVRALFPRVRVVVSPNRLSAGEARNVGFQTARGRLMLCVDQDCIVPEDWIERLTNLLGQPGVGAAGGSIAVANPGNRAGWCVYFLEFLTHFPSQGAWRTDNFLIGSNSAWRPEVLRTRIFPDQTLGEDLLASAAVRRLGFTVLYDPSLTVLHYNREGWDEFFRYCHAMGSAAARSRSTLGGWAIALLQRIPVLAFAIPFLVLPSISWRLLRAPSGYLLRFIMLLPACLVGQAVWANAFRSALSETRRCVRDDLQI